MKVSRPLVRYHGGKWRLAPWIIDHFPEHRVYVEPFGGGGSVLLRKERSYAEIYNDLDGEIVNLFHVARDHGTQLLERLRLTPFARTEFEKSYHDTDCNIERARRTLVRSFMGFGSDGVCGKYRTGFRANSNRSGTTPAHDWKNYAEAFHVIADRLRGIIIENRCALDVMRQHDSHETLHYVDPPYVHSTRSNAKKHNYRYEMDDTQHVELCECLKSLKGHVVLSGYTSELYDSLYGEWERIDMCTHADGAKKRTESLWISPNMRRQGNLFQQAKVS